MFDLNQSLVRKNTKQLLLVRSAVSPLLLFFIVIGFGFLLRASTPMEFERSIMEYLRNSKDLSTLAGPAWMTASWYGLTKLGDTLPRIFFAFGVIIFLWIKNCRCQAVFFAACLLIGIAISSALKHWIDRPRPQWVPHLDLVTNQSFPSGHALNSTLFYMGIACLFMHYLPNRLSRLGLFSLMLMLTLATGISRIALGVHYPTDVLAGWLLGAAILLMWQQVQKNYCAERVA